MLAALFVILFLGGGTTAFLDFIAESESAVKSVMVKDELRSDALNVLGAIEKRAKDHNKQVKKIIKELSESLEGREDNPEAIADISQRYYAALDSYSSDILDLRFELREHVTREEWAQIFPED